MGCKCQGKCQTEGWVKHRRIFGDTPFLCRVCDVTPPLSTIKWIHVTPHCSCCNVKMGGRMFCNPEEKYSFGGLQVVRMVYARVLRGVPPTPETHRIRRLKYAFP